MYLAAVRSLNRYELLGETLRHALNIVAIAHPQLLQEQAFRRVAQALRPTHRASAVAKEQSRTSGMGASGRRRWRDTVAMGDRSWVTKTACGTTASASIAAISSGWRADPDLVKQGSYRYSRGDDSVPL
ncbi:MAG: hypothetical protein R2932_36255 [Caldilineaceae bacterium]